MRFKNNPLNIPFKEAKNLLGCTGNKEGFAEFDDIVHGVRAALYILMKRYPRRGIVKFFDVISEFNGHQDTDLDYFGQVRYYAQCRWQSHFFYMPFYKGSPKKARYLVLSGMCIYESHWHLPISVFDAAYLLV